MDTEELGGLLSIGFFWTVVLEILESPVDCKEIKSVNPKGNQWIFTGRTDAEAETPILWPLDAKNWLIWKAPDAGKDWRQEEKGYNRGWDGWMASPTQWTWVLASSGSWWWTGKPGVLHSLGSQRIIHDWVTTLNWTDEISMEKGTKHMPQNYPSQGWRWWEVVAYINSLSSVIRSLFRITLRGY